MNKSEQDIISECVDAHLAESKNADFECKNCDEHGKRPTDSQLEIEHRRARVKEFEGLNYLPFHSPEQAKRLEVLKKLRVRDNKHAYNQGRRKKLPLDESVEPNLNESENTEVVAKKGKHTLSRVTRKDGTGYYKLDDEWRSDYPVHHPHSDQVAFDNPEYFPKPVVSWASDQVRKHAKAKK